MAGIEVNVSITDTVLFAKLIDCIKTTVLDERIPGGLANEMQDKIEQILKECEK